MKSRSLPATALLGVTLVACSAWLAIYAQGRTARAAVLVMQDEVARGNFSGVVLVSRKGRALFEAAYGFADVDARIANSRQTRFEIGSITKSFTAVLVLQLEQQQRLSLADPVCRFLTECPTGWQAITLQHLLTHSSGIFNFTELPEFDAIRGLPQTRAQVLDRFLHRPLGFAPGEKFAYSNSNYFLLGLVIEKVTGEGYERILQRQILDPLRMLDTGVAAPAANTVEARGYRRDPAGAYQRDPPIHASWSFAAGGLYSTVDDLEKFAESLASGKLLPRAALERMWRPQNGQYGYGFETPPVSSWTFDRRVVEHAGRVPGLVTIFQHYVDDDLTIVVLANHLDAYPPRVARGLAAAAFDLPYESSFERHPVKVSPAVLRRYAGEYELDGTNFTLTARNGALFARAGNLPEIEILFESDDALFIEGADGLITPIETGGGDILGLAVPVRGATHEARRLH